MEDLEDGVREVKEELGIDLPNQDIHFIGYRTEATDYQDGTKNREYQGINLIKISKPMELLEPNPEEVSGIFEISIKECLELFSGTANTAKAHGIIYDYKTCRWLESNRTVDTAAFVKRIPSYYLTVSIMSERLIQNQFPLSIS